ncbi:tetratricopeptide repeat protein [Pseudacidovorax intermedius]|uniref:tetratricopeptide repeat protein n=1 Tax=Pseudacidovorax intermedius TaxID=433924 RepID=UPI0026ED9952|nr:tetratricopeptide repeat protein [Pseudacidovorax intermedius]
MALADDYADVNALLRAGKAAEALDKADRYIAGNPRDPQMRFLRGVILSEQGKPQDAADTFVKLTQDYPELPEPYNNLAVIYAAQGQLDKARDALDNALRLNPNYAVAHENLGDVYVRLAARQYNRAQSFASISSSVAPKLALVRQLVDSTGNAANGKLPAATPEQRRIAR